MRTNQQPLPSTAFCADCGRRNNLKHKPSCSTLAPVESESADDRGPIVIKRVGARVVCTRATGTVTLRFGVVSVAKQAERVIREGGHDRLDECVRQMQAGLWT